MQWYGADGQMTPEALKYIQTDQYRDESGMKYAGGGIAGLLKGPGDGTSDSIPARMPGGGPAALGDGEFVIPARHVSEIGNGSTQAGAKKLYAMMDRIEKARKRTPVAGNTRAERFMPA